jgi:uncharacterized protein (TIGR03083 family)
MRQGYGARREAVPMETAAIYSTTRQRLLELAGTLTADQVAAPLVPTPPWTVLDGYRHLTGVCADVLDDRMEGGPTPAWTAGHLVTRAGRSLEEVTAEWAERGPDLDARLVDAGAGMGFVALDAWTHGQDIRAAVGLGGDREDPLLPGLVDLALGSFGRFYTGRGGPPLRLVVDGEARQLGDGTPEVELRTSAYELMRIVFGRRSDAQVAAAGWTGPSAEARAAIHLFDCPPADISD